MNSHIKMLRILMPLMMIAGLGLTLTFLGPLIGTSTRWAMILAVVGVACLQKRSLDWLSSGFGLSVMLYVLWCFATSLWSQVPQLSFMKSGALAIVAIGLVSTGYIWAGSQPLNAQFRYLVPLGLLVLAAAVVGYGSPSAVVQSGNTVMYQGLVGGPNMFGMLMSMIAMPFVWGLYTQWKKSVQLRLVLLGILLLIVFFLLASRSRTAMLLFLCSGAGLVLSIRMKPKQRITLVITGVLALGAILTFSSSDVLITRYIYKNSDRSLGVFYTREEVWAKSWELAQKGGYFGAGMGVTIGDDEFGGGLSAVGYGREKGNSQLAIMEETGIVGLVLFTALCGTLLLRFWYAWQHERRHQRRCLIGYLGGAVVGFMFSTVFEAWWVAPGAPESIFFWLMIGLAVWHTSLKGWRREARSRHRWRTRQKPAAPESPKGLGLTV